MKKYVIVARKDVENKVHIFILEHKNESYIGYPAIFIGCADGIFEARKIVNEAKDFYGKIIIHGFVNRLG